MAPLGGLDSGVIFPWHPSGACTQEKCSHGTLRGPGLRSHLPMAPLGGLHSGVIFPWHPLGACTQESSSHGTPRGPALRSHLPMAPLGGLHSGVMRHPAQTGMSLGPPWECLVTCRVQVHRRLGWLQIKKLIAAIMLKVKRL